MFPGVFQGTDPGKHRAQVFFPLPTFANLQIAESQPLGVEISTLGSALPCCSLVLLKHRRVMAMHISA